MDICGILLRKMHSGGDPFKNLSSTWLAGGEKGELPEARGQCVEYAYNLKCCLLARSHLMRNCWP